MSKMTFNQESKPAKKNAKKEVELIPVQGVLQNGEKWYGISVRGEKRALLTAKTVDRLREKVALIKGVEL